MDFTKLLAHEMKGPLLALEVRLRALVEHEPSARDCLDEILGLQRLVDRVLAWHDAQGVRTDGRFEVSRVVNLLHRRFLPRVEEVGSTLVIENRAARVAGDAEATAIILSNLLENALTHGGRGVRVELRVDAYPDTVSVSVVDSGSGVPQGLRERIFEPFACGEADPTRSGSGLGLSLSRRLAEAQGGSLELRDAARFVLVLPAAT